MLRLLVPSPMQQCAAKGGLKLSLRHGARLSTEIYTRDAFEFQTVAPFEALQCVWPMAFISGVHFLSQLPP
jgi:hypothetical protein